MYTSVIHIKLVDKSTYRLSQSPSLLISGSGSWAQRDGLLSQAVFRFRFIACIQIQSFSGRFMFLHLSTLPRWDFPGSHGAKNITDLLYFERAQLKISRSQLAALPLSLAFAAENIKNLLLAFRALEKIELNL